MEEESPPWLDSEFLVTVLKEEDESRDVEVVSFSAKPALLPGDNFSSLIYRVKVEYALKKGPPRFLSIIVKAPKGDIDEAESKEDKMAAEPRVYRELLPRFKRIGLHDCDLGPKMYPCSRKAFFVLEDLKESGYTLQDRVDQLDYEHCEIALTKLAKYHAASVACFHEDPEFIKDLGKDRIFTNKDVLDNARFWFTNVVTKVATMVKDTEGCQKTANYILEQNSALLYSASRHLSPVEGRLNVLNHGDFWMSNILFKHNANGKPVDVKFVDFQMPRYASPMLDILFFIYTCATEEARSRKKGLFDEYLQTLNTSLFSLGCEEHFSSEDFDKDVKRHLDWAIVSMCNVLPLVLREGDHIDETEKLFNGDRKNQETFDKFASFMYSSERLREELPKVVRHIEKEFF